MPFDYKWEENGFYCRFWGEVIEREIDAKNRFFSNHPNSGNCEYQIFDGSDIKALHLSDIGIAKMASNDIGMGFYMKKFSMILVGNRPQVNSIYRKYLATYQRAKMDWRVQICDTLSQARKLLGQASSPRVGESNPNLKL